MIGAQELPCEVCNMPGTYTHACKPHLPPPPQANSPALTPWGQARREAARGLQEPEHRVGHYLESGPCGPTGTSRPPPGHGLPLLLRAPSVVLLTTLLTSHRPLPVILLALQVQAWPVARDGEALCLPIESCLPAPDVGRGWAWRDGWRVGMQTGVLVPDLVSSSHTPFSIPIL